MFVWTHDLAQTVIQYGGTLRLNYPGREGQDRHRLHRPSSSLDA